MCKQCDDHEALLAAMAFWPESRMTVSMAAW
jgi:hypothetical protein